jgi:hypothetical protein
MAPARSECGYPARTTPGLQRRRRELPGDWQKIPVDQTPPGGAAVGLPVAHMRYCTLTALAVARRDGPFELR